MKIISWNINRRPVCWHSLLDTDADVALLQEAAEPPPEIAERIEAGGIAVDPAPWKLAGRDCYGPRAWRAAIVRLSDRVQVEWIEAKSIDDAGVGELAVSRLGTLAVACVTPPGGDPIICASMYAPWTRPHASMGSDIVSDVSAHRIVSDLSAFTMSRRGHRVVAAGDLNVLYGHGEHGDTYWEGRYETVFTRMNALGLPFVGPQSPHGRQADPWPEELPKDSKNVPTYHHSRQTPATATRQLDFVFASEDLADSLTVRALNAPDEWGPSDHCKVEIVIA